jgi:isoleucyl-tRNA synthetase
MLRKIRNSARFILGNAFPSTQEWNGKMELSRKDLGIVSFSTVIMRMCVLMELLFKAERYVMHQLYTLEKGALESYASYNFPRGLFFFSFLI